MKTLDFIFIGTPKSKAYQELESDYVQRIGRYGKSCSVYLKDGRVDEIPQKRKLETQLILDKIDGGDCVVLCDETGMSLDTKKFATKISDWRERYQRVVFVVGGAYGVDLELMKQSIPTMQTIRLSDFTLPHELARVVLLEQVYRALTISKGEKYHH